MDNKTYTVYKHTTPTGKVYVGITKQKPTRRWQAGHGYESGARFKYAVQKHGWNNITHEVIESGLNKAEAKAREIYYIKLYDSTNPEKGYNVSPGGDKQIITEEQKLKISATLTGRKLPRETREKMSASRLGHTTSNNTKEKIAASLKRPVVQISFLGEFVRRWDGAIDAAIYLRNRDAKANIMKAAKGQIKSAYGFRWKYEDEFNAAD